jgi:hypothetical protein
VINIGLFLIEGKHERDDYSVRGHEGGHHPHFGETKPPRFSSFPVLGEGAERSEAGRGLHRAAERTPTRPPRRRGGRSRATQVLADQSHGAGAAQFGRDGFAALATTPAVLAASMRGGRRDAAQSLRGARISLFCHRRTAMISHNSLKSLINRLPSGPTDIFAAEFPVKFPVLREFWPSVRPGEVRSMGRSVGAPVEVAMRGGLRV